MAEPSPRPAGISEEAVARRQREEAIAAEEDPAAPADWPNEPEPHSDAKPDPAEEEPARSDAERTEQPKDRDDWPDDGAEAAPDSSQALVPSPSPAPLAEPKETVVTPKPMLQRSDSRLADRRSANGSRATLVKQAAEAVDLFMDEPSDAVAACKKRIGDVMESTPVEMFIIGLVFAYALLIMGMQIFQEDIAEDQKEGGSAGDVLDVIDLWVLFIFLTEICLKSFAFGAPFYTDNWNRFDLFVVVLSIVLSILSKVEGGMSSLLTLRGLLRIFRLVLVFRKVSNTQASLMRVRRQVGDIDLSAPVELVMDTLQQLEHHPRLFNVQKGRVQAAIDIVASGNLYQISIDDVAKGGQLANEARAWVNNATEVHRRKAERQSMEPVHDFMPELAAVSQFAASLVEQYPPEVKKLLEISELEQWDYDMFLLDRLTMQNALPLMTSRLLVGVGLFPLFVADEPTFEVFISAIRDRYVPENTYHNAIHAADVLQSMFWVCRTGELYTIAQMGKEDFFSCLIAAVVHDVGHVGQNNVFLVNTAHAYALRYNDKAVLENMHLATTFAIMAEDPSANIFKGLSQTCLDRIRGRMIGLVLATDMSQHWAKMGKLRARHADCQNHKLTFPDPAKPDDKTLLLEVALHACDISNPAKRTNFHLQWSGRVLGEFFAQGDMEKAAGLPPSMFMDKATTNIAKCQIGFIDFIVMPLFEAMVEVVPKMDRATYWLKTNKEFWVPKVDAMQAQMERGDTTMPSCAEGEVQTYEQHHAQVEAQQMKRQQSRQQRRSLVGRTTLTKSSAADDGPKGAT